MSSHPPTASENQAVFSKGRLIDDQIIAHAYLQIRASQKKVIKTHESKNYDKQKLLECSAVCLVFLFAKDAAKRSTLINMIK